MNWYKVLLVEVAGTMHINCVYCAAISYVMHLVFEFGTVRAISLHVLSQSSPLCSLVVVLRLLWNDFSCFVNRCH